MSVRSATVVERYQILAKDLTIAVPRVFKHCLKVRAKSTFAPAQINRRQK